ncbi:hypothetical protein QQS21_003251 [Conoideocrella luteorostrata]|uniref:Zn(2)-C6 fungal-type domain-containing protein n=1 Tax=Conoideocrella luteorostrata TaxID=1105319 RepID=A0AAJ0G0M3_9HYPO|nr:hypothetical protein QQS21_003251 [Conoideocrella luteorostrata]
MPARPRPPRSKLARRACDSCKVRKIRCSEAPPCDGCSASGIECTFTTQQGTRGPRGLRGKTIQKISESKQRARSASSSGSVSQQQSQAETSLHLADIIDIYATRLYPLWPIVDAAELKETLVSGSARHGSSTQRLADAVALATVGQLKLVTEWKGSPQNCRRRAASADANDDDNDDDDDKTSANPLDDLRISFFLHVHYENLEGGGKNSLLYLREAITHAQILKLEHEASYATLSEAEQQLYRRVFWLLFVTERGVALLHKLPAILKSNIRLPWYGVADSIARIFPDFLKLVHLFWIFDQSGIFEMLRNADLGTASQGSFSQNCLMMLQQSLQESTRIEAWTLGNDIQRADVLVTREWMCAVLWRAALRFGVVIPTVNPLDIAKRFLGLVSQIPSTVLESHGPALEFKTFEIATAVVDAMTSDYNGVPTHELNQVLYGLRDLLSLSRGGNQKLLSLLNLKMSAMTADPRMPLQPSQSVDRFVEDVLLSVDDQGHWHYEDCFPQLQLDMAASASNNDDPDPNSAAMMPGFARSPSPLTQLLLGGTIPLSWGTARGIC